MCINFEGNIMNNKNAVPQEITLEQLSSAKQSVSGRLSRLRIARNNYSYNNPTPIAQIDAFASDVDALEGILNGMVQRLNNAKITI